MANQIPLDDDVRFWSTQMTEHGLFLHLMLEEPSLKAQALQLHQLWKRTMETGADPLPPLNELISFKQMVLGRLRSGQWLGWALPSFVQHIMYEAEYFRSRLGAGTGSAADVNTWLQIVKDHADVGPKLLDPVINNYADQARPLSARIGGLQRMCSSALSHQCLSDADQALQQANTWVRGIPAGMNIVHPALAAHILRENTRGIRVVRILANS
jgi:hypothetical protein